jgi:hypothetical protein
LVDHICPSYILKLQCLSVRLCGQCLEDSSSHCPFPVECFGGWGKGEPGEARGWGGQHGRGRGGRAGKDRVGGSSMGALCTGFTLKQYNLRGETSSYFFPLSTMYGLGWDLRYTWVYSNILCQHCTHSTM